MFLLGQTVGKYQILSNLGSGGFGTVFLAKDAWIDKKVAIKVPHRQSGDEADLLHCDVLFGDEVAGKEGDEGDNRARGKR